MVLLPNPLHPRTLPCLTAIQPNQLTTAVPIHKGGDLQLCGESVARLGTEIRRWERASGPGLLRVPHPAPSSPCTGCCPNHHFSECTCSVMAVVSHLRSWALLCFLTEAAATFWEKWLFAQVTTVDQGFCLVSIHRLMPEYGIKPNYLILSLLLWHISYSYLHPILRGENIVGKEMTEISVEKDWRVLSRWLYFQLVWAGSEISSSGFIHNGWKVELWRKMKKSGKEITTINYSDFYPRKF